MNKLKSISTFKKLFTSYFFCIAISLSFIGCKKDAVPDGIWIGNARAIDKDVYQANPYIWDFQEDSLNIIAPLDGGMEKHGWSYESRNLSIDTFEYSEAQLLLTQDQFRLGAYYFKNFNRPAAVATLPDTLSIIQILEGKNWKTRDHLYRFERKGKLLMLPKRESEAYQYCWRIRQYDQYIFLIKSGTPDGNCNEYVQYLEQLVSFSPDYFTTHVWENGKMIERRYEYVKEASPEYITHSFQVCNPYLYMYAPWHRYYYKGTFYKGGIYTIEKKIEEQYQAVYKEGQTGLIRIRFIVNCAGQAGQFEMLQLDNNYQAFTFDTAISEQLFKITKELQDWIPGKNDIGIPIDTYRILTYRLKNGKVVDIFP